MASRSRADAVAGEATPLVSLDEPLLTAKDAAQLLSVRLSWIPDATRAGQLPVIRVGRHLRHALDA
jgi:excisionase family DNA binding protein